MKDNDITKAVEVFAEGLDCNKCTFYNFSADHKVKCINCDEVPEEFWKGLHDLINRQKADLDMLSMDLSSAIMEKDELFDMVENQKAEIEELRKIILNGDFTSITAQKSNKLWHWQNNEKIRGLNEEIERLQTMNSEQRIGLNALKRTAIKEFAERLKQSTYFMSDEEGFGCSVVFVADIDNLVKEMTEGNGNADEN